MTKRALAIVLTLLLILPAAAAVGGVIFASENPFALFDSQRETLLSAALGVNLDIALAQTKQLPSENRLIVRFDDNASLEDIKASLKNTPYRLLAESGQRLFVISDTNGNFAEEYSNIIAYTEPDLQRETAAVVNDPFVFDAYQNMGVYNAWDRTRGKSNVIVAVLDTGVDRSHEDFAGTNILAGYDAVNRVAGVNDDSAGHGTAVIGLIAATADNGLGIAGISHGVTVLPVKVSSTGTVIYSSDLISGIRFAADAGAKVINMSVGGYSPSYAEQEAVNYAVEKGCILVSASGNGGNLSYADQKNYPASYDGVISVASCNALGERSDFSQYNDAVDVAAMGENIIALAVEDGISIYKGDSGTSFSCAFVSGIAALAASYIDDGVRFEHDEFLSLIINTCGSKKSDELGYGVIDAEKILSLTNLPIISGVYDGGVYTESVKIGFNRGQALLDGEAVEDGEAVITTGYHTFSVSEGEYSRTIRFRLNYDPLSYDLKEFPSFAYFEFERGTALLDGFPYKSGEKITASGRHSFVLTDGDESVSKTVVLQYALPTVYGVENGVTYDRPVDIRIVGNGTATLDGNRIYGEAAVVESGLHTLYVQSGNGVITKKYEFTVNNPLANITNYDYACASAAVDEENGYICVYGDTLVGVRIYDIASPESYLHFIPTGRVYSHAFMGENLLLFGDAGITVLTRSLALQGEVAVREAVFVDGIGLYACDGNTVYGFGNQSVYTIDMSLGTATLLAELGVDCETALYGDNSFCLASPSSDRLITIFNCENLSVTQFVADTPSVAAPRYFGNGYIAIGNLLLNSENGQPVLEFCSDYAVGVRDGLLFTQKHIVDIATGAEVGSFAFDVWSIFFGENGVYLFGADPVMAFVTAGGNGVNAYGAAERVNYGVSENEPVNSYRENIYYDRYSTPASVAVSQTDVFFLLSSRNTLYSFNAGTLAENNPVALRFMPERVFCSGGYVLVSFKNAFSLYIAPDNNPSEGVYIDLPAECRSVCVADNKVFAVSNGRVVTCNPDGSALVVTSVRATDIIYNGVHLVVRNDDELLLYNTALVRLYGTLAVGARLMTGGSTIAVDDAVYDAETLTVLTRLDAPVLAISGNTAVTKNGVFDLALGAYVGDVGVKADIAAIADDNALFTFGGSTISVCRFDNGSEIVAKPEISGVEEGGVYHDNVQINYTLGVGYIDGQPFASGDIVGDAGRHTLLITLPCGQSVSVGFVIEAHVAGIEFLSAQRTMSIGETLHLRIKYLPEGASSLPVVFKCDEDGLSVSEDGSVTALAVGKYTVRAESVTHLGTVTAECVITVRDDLIAFLPESGVTVDRDSGLVLGVSTGLSVSDFISLLYSGTNVTLADFNGKPLKGFVGTGCQVLLYDANGAVSDMLTVVVKGDTDGDGFISAYDLYEHGRILRGYSYPDVFVRAADMNDNGAVADNDYRQLKNIILKKTDVNVGESLQNFFVKSSLQTASSIRQGSIIDVAVCFKGAKYVKGVMGVLEFGEGLEFVEAEGLGWEFGCSDLGGSISFYAYEPQGNAHQRVFGAFVSFKFRVTASAGEKISFSADKLTVSFEDGCKTVGFEKLEKEVTEAQIGDFGISVLNAQSFKFDPEVRDYSVTIPYDNALADVAVSHSEGQTVTVEGMAIPVSGDGYVTVRCTEANGKTTFYNIRVRRATEPKFDTNCRLETLEVEGYHLSPSFNPDVLEYSISVPHGTQKISLYCVAQNSNTQVVVSDTTLKGSLTPITVTVGAPGGETLVYTINVKVLPPVEVSEESAGVSSTALPENEGGWVGLIIAIIAVALGGTILLVIKRTRLNKE